MRNNFEVMSHIGGYVYDATVTCPDCTPDKYRAKDLSDCPKDSEGSEVGIVWTHGDPDVCMTCGERI